jgi:16S rRNA (guanine966-N2)-methyltransferase
MRVVAGSAKGRRLVAPAGESTRPTSDRVRESVFNILASLGEIEGAEVLDLFAGSGALAIEALSRGASRAVLVERDPAALAVIDRNLAATGVGPAQVVRRDALAYLGSNPPGFDIAFCDPPYGFEGWAPLLSAVPARLVVAESNRVVAPAEGWDVIRSRRYGGTVVEVLERTSPAGTADSNDPDQDHLAEPHPDPADPHPADRLES